MVSARVALLSVGILLLSIQGTRTTEGQAAVPIKLSVVNDVSNLPAETYFTHVVEKGVLLGALNRIQETQPGFRFTTTVNPNFGLFLESVNGVAGSDSEKTYWQLLSEDAGHQTPLSVGIGCYIPSANEHIVLKFTTWDK